MSRPVNSRVQHGQAACADYGCKRSECLQARRERQKRNKYLLSTGRPGTVDGSRAGAHLWKFREAGLPDLEIMARIGLSKNTLHRALRGGPLTRAVERRILDFPVPPKRSTNDNTASVDATGTQRRLQALISVGWPARVLQQRLGVHAHWINRVMKRKRVTMATADQVRRLYDGLWSRMPAEDGVPEQAADSAQTYARVQDWHGPLAWDDDTIDDPSAVPQTDALEPPPTLGNNVASRFLMGEAVVLDMASRREVLRYLMEWTTQTPEEVGERLDMTGDAVSRAWFRIKAKAREEGGKVPWRRVYIPKNELNRNDMESAA